MKIKIKSTSSNSETLNIYKELLKKYNPVETTIEYYAEEYNETYQDPAYLIDVPSLAIIPELAEELEEDIIYRRGSKRDEEGYQEPFLLIYDGYIE